VKSLPKLVDHATNHGALHIGTGRMGPSSASSWWRATCKP